MKFEIRDAWHRHRLDRQYLNSVRSNLHGCPKCGKLDDLTYAISATCNLEITCYYHLKCKNFGYEPAEWYDNIHEAVSAYQNDNIANKI